MAGIHGWTSLNWNPTAVRSNQNHRGRLTRNPSTPNALATQRTASSRPLGRSSRTIAPTSGVYVITESRCVRRKSIQSAPRLVTGAACSSIKVKNKPAGADDQEDADQHRQRVVLHEAVL